MLDQIQGFRLSPQQRRLWRLQTQNLTAYHLRCGVRIEGTLDAETLQEAVRRVVARHEILRTVFPRRPDMKFPVQSISERAELGWHEEDLRTLDAAQKQVRIEELYDEADGRAFDLEHGPLLAMTLVTESASNHLLLISMSALCSDMVGLKLLVREIAHAYAVCLRDGEFDDEATQYADLSEWQNELFESEDGETGREFWQQQDVATPLRLKLPFERRAPQAVFAVQRHALPVSPAVSSAAIALAGRHGTSVSALVLTCWQLLLSRLTTQPGVGVFFDGRDYKELEESLGLLAKYLPVAARLEDAQTFGDAVGQMEEAVREVGRWQESFSWEQVSDLVGETHAAETFIPFCFDFDEQPTHDAAAGLAFTIERQHACIERFKVKLSGARRDDALVLEFQYDPDLFKTEDIELLAGQFLKLLTGAVSAPETPVGALDIITEQERERWVVEFNRTWADYPAGNCVHQLFEEQAARTPSRIAVSFGAQQLTYSELNAHANRLARRLRGQGVAPDVLVGLCMERSLEMMVAVLGILKAGGAYVPFDPALPAQRLVYMLDDSRPAVILTQSKFKDVLPESGASVIGLDDALVSDSADGEDNLDINTTSRHLAYVIYTSGSTGQPKGVMVEHRGLVNYLQWCLKTYVGTGGDDGGGAPVHSPLGFDLTVTSLFCPLLSGQEVVLLDEQPGIDALSDALRTRRGFGLVKITPAHLQALNETLPPAEASGCAGAFVIGGEALLSESLKFWRTHAPGTRLINEYGPTETVVGCCVYEVSATDATTGAVPIGKPIFNTQIYLLDAEQRIVPVGVPGELYIGGAGVARGYLRRPDLTAEKFVPDPFNAEPGARLYRSGDLARYLVDGEIEFLGRIDNQVKVRGFRIEPGEIEATLNGHESIAEAVVEAREDVPGEKRLVAYVVPAAEASPTSDELQSFLADVLPDYMIPSVFISLRKLPLTPNGKVDRRALPLPGQVRPESVHAYVAPRTPVEEVLTGVWAEVLGAEQIGINDNFFELGGHSLLATQIISRVRNAFGVELPMGKLFEAQTPAALAVHIERARRDGDDMTAQPIERTPRDRALPLSFAQQRLWFLDKLEPGMSTYNLPSTIRLTGHLDVPALRRALNEVVRRHESLRTTFRLSDGEPVQQIAPHLTLDLEPVDIRRLPTEQRETEARRLAQEEAQRSFDLAQGPLVRASLLRLADDEHVLLYTMHHIISDGWSMDVLVREVAALYEAFAQGRVSPLAELEIQYADYAVWQREHLRDEVLERQLAYWRAKLEGVGVLELPTDHVRPAMPTYNGAQQVFSLPADLSAALKALNRREGVTLYMSLLAAFQALLHRYTGMTDISVGTPIAGRNRAEIEPLIGLFVNTLVMRTDLSGNPGFQELVGRVRAVAMEAYAHQDVPFEKLVEELQPERELSRNPLFQVMFEIQNETNEGIELPGLALRPLVVENKTAKFDLTLLVEESGDGLAAKFEYNTDLFESRTIEHMGRHFQTLLAGMVAEPARPVSEVPLLTTSEWNELAAWNETKTAFPSDTCFQRLFEEQVERTPETVAASHEGVELTYGELNARANRLARHLHTLGVGTEVPVGVFMARGLDLLVSMLAVFKAGGVYVPLDPAYPKDRLSYILADAQVAVLLTHSDVAERVPEHGLHVVCLDTERDALNVEDASNLAATTRADNLAYVIYTSGSTGKPKGAMVEHRGMVNHLYAKLLDLGLTQTDVLVQNASQCFDISVWQFLAALLVGGRVEILGDEVAHSPARLSETVSRARVTILEVVPAIMSGLLEVVDADDASRRHLAGLRWLVVTGEALPPELSRRWLRVYPDITLLNAYGPTECSDDVTHYAVREAPAPHVMLMPIGRPVANMRIHILDRGLRPLPVGIAGELCVTGVGVGRGYLYQPALTADRFVPNPFNNEPGTRLYKTGDLARFLPDGRIEFLGRIDQQVKVRGFRIELGEIETWLSRHVAVKEAVVMLSETTPGEGRLVAYVVADGDAAPTPAELRTHLREMLPEYMIPSGFVMLKALPLTSNGKVDRRALGKLEVAGAVEEREYVAPRTPVEEVVAEVLAELLGRARVGAHDNFFEIGGHSLMAIQVSTRLLQSFKVDLPLRSFFEAPTVAGLSENLIALEAKPGQTEKIAQILRKIKNMSAEEKRAVLQQRKQERGN